MSDQLGQVILLVAELAVVIAVLVIANLGDRYLGWRSAAMIAGGSLVALAGLLALTNLLTLVATLEGAATGIQPTARLWAGYLIQLAGAALGGLVLLPQVRRAMARWLRDFRPESTTSAVGASLYVLVLTYFVSAQVSVDQLQALSQDQQSPSLLFIVGTNQLPMLIVAFVGVGLFVRRRLPETLERLGLIWPGWRWIGASLAVAGGLFLMGIFFDQLMTLLTPQQSSTIQKVSNQLLRNVNNLPAIIALGLAAGVGEEVLFRGALLPRLGNVAAALLFATLHAQYAISLATLEIFILGLILGLLRKRAGTTGCIVAHAGYDIIVGGISLLH